MLADPKQNDDKDVTAPKHPRFAMDDDNKTVSIANKKTMEFDPEKEPLLRDNPRRFVIFPIKYEDMWAMYKKVSKYHTAEHLISSMRGISYE